MEKRIYIYINFILLLALLAFIACTSQYRSFTPEILKDGKYDSEFPSRSPSPYLEKLSEIVKRISSIAFYEGYIFPKEDHVTKSDILSGSYGLKDAQTFSFYNSSAGTATIIYAKKRKIAVLTAAHIVDYPDTIITYHTELEGENSGYIESFSLKTKQRNFLADLTDGSGFEVLAIDQDLDVAILGKEFILPPLKKIPIFNYPLGTAKALEWGSFVYIIGWPKGNKMVTRGIVSSPNRDEKHSFLTDALFNRGFSGGIILAIRDGIPNFELVGIVGSVSATFEQILVPEAQSDASKIDIRLPYKGDIYIKNQQKIDYGVTFGISIDAIKEFLNDHRQLFESYGFSYSDFFKEKL